jgi:hypothetical protein
VIRIPNLRCAPGVLLGVLLLLPEIEMRAQSGDANWSSMGPGLNSPVVALAASGGDLYAGGAFTTAGGISASCIAKWDGSSWTALGSGMNRIVRALAVSGADVYAGGDFTNAGGSTANYIAKWDGKSWTALGSGMGGPVVALAVSGSNVYAGGFFSSAGGIAANVAKWDGSAWTALGSGVSSSPIGGGYVYALAVSGSDVYAGGRFTKAGGGTAYGIAKWNESSWSALGSGLNDDVWALAASGSDVFAGGHFKASGSATNYIAKWDGSSWSALGSGMNNYVWALAVSGSDLYAGGTFSTAGGKLSAYIARAYQLALPAISLLRSGNGVLLSWASVDTAGFALEQTGALDATTSWVTNTASVTDDGTHKSVTLPATNSLQFFRLSRP